MKYACPRCGSIDIWTLLWPFGRCRECGLLKLLSTFRLINEESDQA